MSLEDYACKVCGNVPDKDGTIEHGRGCYVVSEDGGGFSCVEFPNTAIGGNPPIGTDKGDDK
jgi:hypothetical protein